MFSAKLCQRVSFLATFVTSPISCVFLVAAAISIVLTIRKQLNDRKKATA